MSYIPITPFRRVVDAALLKHQNCTSAELPPEGVNKWAVLREIAAARRHFNLSDRGVTVLQALLSFHPETVLGTGDRGLVVYPSNAAICDRLNGMACSTMRRHLTTLINAGLILRRDSPNGKRYVKRYKSDKQAFGFDLTPLVARFDEIRSQADVIRAEQEQLQHLRRTVSLMRRDLASLVVYGQQAHPEFTTWDALSDTCILTARTLRRTLNSSELRAIEASLRAALETARDAIDALSTGELSTNDVQSEQHIQNSDKDTNKSESHISSPTTKQKIEPLHPNVPLPMVLAVCSEIANYVPDKIRGWHQLVSAAELVSPMMGISKTAWIDAVKTMGRIETSVVVAAMLERFADIRSAGGYLRHLTQKHQRGEFSSGPMLAALLNRDAAGCSQL